MVRCYERYC